VIDKYRDGVVRCESREQRKEKREMRKEKKGERYEKKKRGFYFVNSGEKFSALDKSTLMYLTSEMAFSSTIKRGTAAQREGGKV
jgi:hypothetical protein